MDTAIEPFLNYLKTQRRFSPYTVRNYGQALERFRRHVGEVALGALRLEHVRSYMVWAQGHYVRKSLGHQASALRHFFQFCLERGWVTQLPTTGLVLPKPDKGLPLFLSIQQMEALLQAPRRALETGRLSPFFAFRDRLILEILYGGGLRVSELVALRYQDVDSQTGIATVLGKGNKQRLCPLGVAAVQALLAFRRRFVPEATPESPIIIGDHRKPLSPRNIQLIVKKHLRYAGLPSDITPHKLRHSYATHLLDNDAPLRIVQELLGHASLASTQIYTHVGMARLQAVYMASHPRA